MAWEESSDFRGACREFLGQPEKEPEGGKDAVGGWICAKARDVVVDWFLSMREREKSRGAEGSSLSCWGRLDP